MASGEKRRITLIESDKSAEEVRRQVADKNLVEVELVVRKPDNADAQELAIAARLCGCRRVCVAFIDPE